MPFRQSGRGGRFGRGGGRQRIHRPAANNYYAESSSTQQDVGGGEQNEEETYQQAMQATEEPGSEYWLEQQAENFFDAEEATEQVQEEYEELAVEQIQERCAELEDVMQNYDNTELNYSQEEQAFINDNVMNEWEDTSFQQVSINPHCVRPSYQNTSRDGFTSQQYGYEEQWYDGGGFDYQDQEQHD